MAREDIHINVGGDVSGQIAIGNNNVQIQNQGGKVTIIQVSSRSPFKKRSRSIQHRPRLTSTLLDRVSETQVVRKALQNSVSVSVFGEGGVGKTTLLSNMGYLPEVESFRDGVVYFYVPQQGLDDLFQAIFDTFYSSPRDVMPTAGQLRHYLKNIRAVILLDDLMLTREEMQALIAMVPLSCFVCTSTERNLWGDGETIQLAGLPEQEQVELFAKEIKRPLTEKERTDALIICYYLQGNPLKIIQAASLVTASGKAISDIKKQFQGDPAPLLVIKELLKHLSESEQKVLALLGAYAGVLIPLGIIGSLLKLTNIQVVLNRLVDLGLIWNQGAEYGVAGSLAGQLKGMWNLASWEDSLIHYFASWLRQQPKDSMIEDVSDVLLKVIQKAGEKNQWSDVINLGRALERILILRKRWQAWSDILNLILNAAKTMGDRNTQAWALHQLGTRALCLNNAETARHFLTDALTIRQAIGDTVGLAVTQHNLNVLNGAPVGHQTRLKQVKIKQASSGFGRFLVYGFGGVITLGLLLVFSLWLFFQNPVVAQPTQSPSPSQIHPSNTVPPTLTPMIETATITPTFTPTITPSATPTFTNTPSSTPTYTPTPTPFDFVLNANKAIWQSQDQYCQGGDPLPYNCFGPVPFVDLRGTAFTPNPTFEKLMDTNWHMGAVRWLSNPVLEDGSTENLAIFVHPYYGANYSASTDGRIWGIYDLTNVWVIKPGDQIEAKVGFLKGANQTAPLGSQDGVIFHVYFSDVRLDQALPNQSYSLSDNFDLHYDGNMKAFVFSIPTPLAGKSGWFTFEIGPMHSYLGDWVVLTNVKLIHP